MLMHASSYPPAATTGSLSFLQRLKQETAAAHRQLEATALSKILMSSSITEADYAHYLQAMAPVVAYTEQVVFFAVEPFFCDLEKRRKLHLISNDLAALHADLPYVNNSWPNGWHQFLPGSMPALAFMYVMEGSTLGGKIIGRHVKAHLGFDETYGASYFNGYGDATGTMWKAFLEPFSQIILENGTEDLLIKSANEVYEQLYRHFESSTR